jgi:5,10-methylenetetrahydrofolate reductase
LRALAAGGAVLTDLTTPPYDAAAVRSLTRTLAGTCDGLLVGEHQNRPDYPPSTLTALIREADGVPWVTLACRDRNRVVLEQELAGLELAGVDGVLCVTGDGRAQGVRPEVTQVFDLDGTRLAALANAGGLAVAVPESPDAVPRSRRAARVVEKQHAGAHLVILNHVMRPSSVRDFVDQARDLGLAVPVVAAVAVFTDERSAKVLQNFPGLGIDPTRVEGVLRARDVEAAGISAAVDEAFELLSIAGVAGVNLSGLASSRGEEAGAEVKAQVGARIRAGA